MLSPIASKQGILTPVGFKFFFEVTDVGPEEPPVFLLQDAFLTAESAPIESPRTAEPGPGALVVTDTGNNADIAGGAFVMSGFVLGGDPAFYSQSSFARSTGLAAIFTVDGTDARILQLGFDDDGIGNPKAGFRFQGGTELRVADPTTFQVGSYSTDDFPQNYIVINRSAGNFLIKGTTLMWVAVSDVIDPVYVGFANANSANDAKCNEVRLAQLAAPWTTDNGIATDVLPGAYADQDYDHEADCLIELTVTTVPTTGGVHDYTYFRFVDNDNNWSWRVESGGLWKLLENTGGSSVTRASGEAGSVTNGDRVVIVLDDDDISIYIANVLGGTYASATNHKTAILGKTRNWSNGVLEDLASWPRVLSGTALTELEKYTQPYEPWSGYWLQVDFSTPDAAPLTNPYVGEVGQLVPVETDGTLAASGGNLVNTAQGTPAWNVLGVYDATARTRAAGLGIFSKSTPDQNTNDCYPVLWSQSASLAIANREIGVDYRNDGVLVLGNSGPTVQALADYAASTEYEIGVLLRSSGAFVLIKGGVFAEWTMLWVDAATNTATLYATTHIHSGTYTYDYFRVAQLAAPWTTDNGIATDSVASLAAGDTYTHEADCILEFTVDNLPTGDDRMRVMFRYQDDNNCWYIHIDPSGNLLLIERVTTGATRGTASSALSGGERIVVIADDEDITVYYDNTQAFAYGSAANFKTLTAGKRNDNLGTEGGTASNLITWPRTLSGSALAELEKYTQPYTGFYMQDEFITPDAAPITSPRTAEPGPGTLTAVENDGTLAIAGGKLVFTAQSTPKWGDLGVWSDVQTRVAGVMMSVNITHDDNTTYKKIGWDDDASGDHVGPSIYFHNSGEMFARVKYNDDVEIGPYTGTSYYAAVILRSSGAFYLIKGGAYTQWTLLYTNNLDAVANKYASFITHSGAGTLDSLRVAQLAAPWTTDNGIATDSIASPSAGNTFTHEADFLLEWTEDTVAGSTRIRFRKQDANNYWYIKIDGAGTIELFEVVSGSGTNRGLASGVVSNGDRIMVICNDETITVYYSNTQAFTYAFAANFKTETDGEVNTIGNSISNLITWPRTLSGTALTELEKYTQPYTGFYMQDEFTTPDAAPITSPRTAEPGPGTLVITDTGNNLSIAGGIMTQAGKVAAGDPMFYANSTFSRAAGLGMFTQMSMIGAHPAWEFGFETSAHPYPRHASLKVQTNDLSIFANGAGTRILDNELTAATSFEFATILRSVGAFSLFRGESYTDWTLGWVADVGASTPLHAGVSNRDDADSTSFSYLRLAQLAAPWNTDNGIATDSIASPIETDTFTHEADCLLEYTVDALPSSGNITIRLRQQDVDNRWFAIITSGGTLQLYEEVADSPVLRGGTGLGAVSNSDRISIICDDDDITVYIETAQAFTYGSATNFKTATAGQVDQLQNGGTISNLITWPRTLSGAALTELEKYTQP